MYGTDKERYAMYKIGDKVIYKHSGVYLVDGVETPSFVKDKGALYYKLSHIYSNAKETVYVPVDSEDAIRPVADENNFDKALKSVNEKTVVPFCARQPQLVTEHYKNDLAVNTLESSLTVLKALYIREKECEGSGKKLRQAEGHYLALTEKAVCEEMCECLKTPPEEAREKIRSLIEC